MGEINLKTSFPTKKKKHALEWSHFSSFFQSIQLIDFVDHRGEHSTP
jgi:hypothetical protein